MTMQSALRVRKYLLESGFTADGVLARVGSAAFAALGRGLTVPVRRALADAEPGSSPLDALVEAFLLSSAVRATRVPDWVTGDLVELGMVRRDGDAIVPLVEVHPYGEPDTDWFIVSDVGAPATPDHVLGLGGASVTLAQITPRRDVGRALDVGCGAGVQVLHASRHAGRIVATDTNPRALALTSLSLALSGVPAELVDVRLGSLFGPVSDERFDLVVSNPPFVISPSHRFTYRDAGLPGDELSRLVVRGAAAHLAPGGMAAVLGNWLHVTGEDWTERVSEWVAGTGVNAWIVERDSQSVSDYAATWLRDAGSTEGREFDDAMHEWLDAFADESAEEVGFGWFILVDPRNSGTGGGAREAPDAGSATPPGHLVDSPAAEPWIVVEDLARSERLPRGDEVLAFLAGCQAVANLTAPDLLALPACLADGATVTTTTHVAGGAHVDAPPRLGLAGVVGPGGWRPAIAVPPALAAALLADGAATIGERIDAAAQAEGIDPLDVLGPSLIGLRELVRASVVRTC
ncbi:MAG: methyltransferase [Candidatus Nanopelagicales bacterium]